MKTVWKIIGGVFLAILFLAIGLNFYFSDQRLKNIVLPYLSDAAGQPVEVESMSLSFFSTFPHPGIEINDLYVPGAQGDTLLNVAKMTAGVELFPLLSNEVNVTELVLNRPRFTYKVYSDSTSNLDFFLTEPEADSAASPAYTIDIPYFEISNGHLGYRDFTSNTAAIFENLDGDLSLSYADSIKSSIDVEVGNFSLTIDSLNYVNGIPLTLTEESIIFPEREVIELKEGTFSIRGLAMDLAGSLRNWSDTLAVNLRFNSSTDNFGDLLRLFPENSYTKNLETRGSLALQGNVKGPITDKTKPDFDIKIDVSNGYLKDPDLPQPIEDIQLTAHATNKLATIDTLHAIAGANSVTGSGTLTKPLEKDGRFDMSFVADVDLSTVNQFYDITQLGLDRLEGQLDVDAQAAGTFNEPANAHFNGHAVLANGLIKYRDVPKAFTNINLNATGTQDLLTLKSLNLQAAENSLSAEGQILNLLNEDTRRINNMRTNIRFNLATLKDFYPIDEDTLRLSGLVSAQATLDGQAGQIERAVQSGSIVLKDGMIDYYKYEAPFRDITLEAILEGPRMTLVQSHINSAGNRVEATGVINDYLSENRTVNIRTQGSAKLSQLSNYYELKPAITDLGGDATFNLVIHGPLDTPQSLKLTGKLAIKNASMQGESIREPVKNMDGTFSLTPEKATLDNLSFNMGASDFNITGSLSHYMAYLEDETQRGTTPQLTGKLHSTYLNLDELINWSDTSSTFNLELPDLVSNVSADIERMKITGVTMRNLQAQANSTPKQINMTSARVELFEGVATGSMTWEIPVGSPSTFNFKGALDSLRLEAFFKEYPILGENSQFHKFISGTFHTQVEYTTQISTALDPLLATTELTGSFGMSKARVVNHPLQQKLSSYTKINELRDVALDKWQSSVSVDDNILTFRDLSLTSDNIGLQLDGTQHLVTDKIDFHVALLLPARFKKTIASVITSQAAEALTRENGTLMVPLRITGNYSSPNIEPDQTVIRPLVQEYLKEKAADTLKKLFGRDKKTPAPDTAAVDTTSNP